jgi:uncharacterized protein YkwD
VVRPGRKSLSLVVCLTVAGFAPGFALAPTLAQPGLASLDAGVLTQLNRIRVAHHLTRFTLNAELGASAAEHSGQMIADGYFAHASENHTVFWKRIGHYYPLPSAGGWAVGENLVWSSSYLDASGALALWMASPDHKANILNPRWHEIGISARRASTAGGVFGGDAVTLITTDFGTRT